MINYWNNCLQIDLFGHISINLLPEIYSIIRSYQQYNHLSSEYGLSLLFSVIYNLKSVIVNISTRQMLLDMFKDKSELISDSWNTMMHLIQEGILSID